MTGDAGVASRRLTRSSVGAVASSRSSRRAFGDVSNQAAANSNAASKASKPPVRRSRRLSSDPELLPNPAEEEATIPHRRSRRLSEVAKAKQEIQEQKPAPTQKKSTSLKQHSSKTKNPERKKPRVKRVRGLEVEDAEPLRKARRKSLRGSKSLPASEEPVGPCTNLCPDILTTTDYGLQRAPFDARQYTPKIAPYDEENANDAQEAPSYVTDIFQRLYDSESTTRPRPYMDRQGELNSTMRSILVDWIVEVHMKFRLLPETLYLCINIIDRYLCRQEVPRRQLQLVGVTALLLACKYEEIYPPEVKDCVYITDRAYTRQQVLDMEAHIVKTLQFRMTVPTAHPFLQRFLYICKASRTTKHLANYYLERMLQEYGTLQYRPSLVAAAAVSLALNNPDILDNDGMDVDAPGVPGALLDYTGFSHDDIIEVAGLLESKVRETNTTSARRRLVAVKRKYESDRYDNVSTTFTPPLARHIRVP